ncbi:MAG: efflux RND transporter periplasmic adaptor subunit [Clostridia bacterium]|nr:efflux RND transporter periplasmic adaptor subunit [Clostridia bacterium]
MKKYGVLLLGTVLVILGIMAGGYWYSSSIPEVKTMVLHPQTAHQTVYCMGEVERNGSETVKAEEILWIEKWYVEKGDEVAKGEPLCQVVMVGEDRIAEMGDYGDTLRSALMTAGRIHLDKSQTWYKFMALEERTTILSPMNGTVTDVCAEESDILNEGEKVCSLADNENLVVRVSISEKKIAAVFCGQYALLSGEAFRDTTLSANVSRISSSAVTQASTAGKDSVFEVILIPEDPDQVLKPGYGARAEIITAEKENCLVIPMEALCQDEEGTSYVFVAENNQTAVRRDVETGEEYKEGMEITGGLLDGERIILEPENCRSGSPVYCVKEEKTTA